MRYVTLTPPFLECVFLNLEWGNEDIPWRRKWQPTPVFLPGESLDRGDWQATVLGVAKSQSTHIHIMD